MSSKSNGNWQPPSKVHGPRWHGFLMSHLNSNWRQAKFTYCLHIFQDARPHKLFAHLKIPVDKKIKYLHDVLQQSTINNSGEIFDTQSSARASTPASNFTETSIQTSHPNTSYSVLYFQSFSNERTQELHELLLKALIILNVSFQFIDNPYFHDYQRALVRSPYKIPTCDSMTSTILPLLHAKHEAMILHQISSCQRMTLSIDGWTDISGFSIYALLLLRGQYIKQFVEILDLNLKRHTAENLVEAVKNCLDRKCISLKNISAVVTDSPSVIIKLQNLLTKDKPYIMKTHCVLHAFNIISKHFIMHPTMALIVKGNKVLVNSFSNSSFWGEFLTQWASNNNISHKEDTPSIPSTVILVIENQDHFTSNDTLVSLLKPVVDSISRLENSNTKLSDIWQEFLVVYKSLFIFETFTQGHYTHDLGTC
ncbi:hypothetical protein O181_088831 [Austropuccinia psidii MF-1]|uniref:DUF659 domain-containing protein n=1 Tax=Austropuccinia psidii MF-1 TaxID=1389203 RepID=A0A9Q3ISA7_9BASI|nr:hypothetical protein [Austropuccinia psidii MF-1]